VQTEAELLEVACKTQGKWREYIAGRKNWEITAKCLVVSSLLNVEMLQTGQRFTLKSYEREDQTDNIQGRAILEQCRITASRGALVQGYFKFRGTQSLTAFGIPGDFNFDFNDDFNNYSI
jgi:predicted secreted protein